MQVLCCNVGIMGTNCYLVFDDDRNCVVIDPGSQAEKLIDAVESLSLNVQVILLTHGHFDHILAVNEIREKYDCTVCIFGGEADLLSDKSKNLIGRFCHSDISVHADRLLKDGDTVSAGKLSFKVLHTPGHTSGSVCYISEDSLFSGDTLLRGCIGRCDFPTGSEEEMGKSLSKLLALPTDYVIYPGHGDKSTLDFEKDNNPYFMYNH